MFFRGTNCLYTFLEVEYLGYFRFIKNLTHLIQRIKGWVNFSTGLTDISYFHTLTHKSKIQSLHKKLKYSMFNHVFILPMCSFLLPKKLSHLLGPKIREGLTH